MQTGANDRAIQSLEDEYNQLIRKAEGLKNAIEILKKNSGKPMRQISSNTPAVYDSGASNKAKILYFIKREQRFLHIRELAKMANELEPGVSVEDFQKRFSPALSVLRTEEKLTNTRVGKSLMNTFWGSVKWLTDDDTIKAGHEINEEYVTAHDKEDEFEI